MNSNCITENNENSRIITNNYTFNNNSNEKEDNKNRNKSSEKVIINKSKNFKINEIRPIIPSSSCDIIPKSKITYNNSNNKLIKESGAKNDKKLIYNILVAVRIRPLNKKEKKLSKTETVSIINEKLLKLKDPNGFLNPNNIRSKEIILEFDYIFDSLTQQETIFNYTTKMLIDNIINGYNATVFAYGATGAGKTYTMLGDEENPGIMPLALKELFNKILKYKNREYIIKLWYIEIYNENIRDLLVNNKNNNEYLEIREDPIKGIFINNVTEITTNSKEDIIKLLKKGNKNRTTEETDVNKTSSRSHAILQIIVSYKEKNKNVLNINEIKYGKLNLIDLAGSERASVTKNKGIRLFEGANINKSLLTLGNCINALYDKNQKGNKIYIPYRDSKLTRILKDSLGGNSRTVMIASISPFIFNFDDTYNTLKYAQRARCIKTKLKLNILGNAINNNYLDVIKNLQNKINILENELISTNHLQNYNINSNNKPKKVHSISPKFLYSQKRKKINKYIFNLDDDMNNSEDINVKTNEQKILENKIKYSFNKTDKSKINENTKDNQYIIDKDLDEYLIENDKKISLIIEDFIQQSEAEIQLKQKIINIQYNIILLYKKIENNVSFKNNNSEDKIKLINLKKILEKNIEAFNEISERNKRFIKKYIENTVEMNDGDEIELNYLQKKYVYMIFKNTKIQRENIEIKFKYIILKNEKENNINYIKELENQVKLRDLMIKELLILDNILPNNENIDIKMNSILSNILKNENNNYKSFSEMKNKGILSKIKNKRKINNTSNRPRSISINNKTKISNNTIFIGNTNHSNDEEYIIDFDKNDSKFNNSYLKLKIPSLIKSNSSFNIHDYNNTGENSFKKIENKKAKHNSRRNDDVNEHVNEIDRDSNVLYNEINNNQINNSNSKVKSMLKEIKNLNTDISSKLSIIENQTNRNQMEISGQIQKNMKIKEIIFKKINSHNINRKINKDNLIKNEITDNNSNDLNNKYINYSINCQVINNNISNKKNLKNKKSNSTKKLLKSENTRNNNIRIFDSNKSKPPNTLETILLSQVKTKNKIFNEIKKEDIKISLLNKDLKLNKSFINSSNKNTINASERKNSLLNKYSNNNNKKEYANYVCLNNRTKLSLNKQKDNDRIPFVDDLPISHLNINNCNRNSNNNSKEFSTIYIGIDHEKTNKYPLFNNNKSFHFIKKTKEKIPTNKSITFN